MADGATSSHAGVQKQLDRLHALSAGKDALGLCRIERLCRKLKNPQNSLPPVIHVAGTNGKGSTCAFLRAILEADGKVVHGFTSPHLVRFNERFRISGTLVENDILANALKRVLDINDVGASFFEVCTAAAFLCFAEFPADVTIVEVGLGGRLDATNVIPDPLVCGIASLGIDHEAFLLAEEPGTPELPLARIGFEKAGIAKPGVPLVTQRYDTEVMDAISAVAAAKRCSVFAKQAAWTSGTCPNGLRYDDSFGSLTVPLPSLQGAHQAENAALAIAMLRHQHKFEISDRAFERGIKSATWPARLQRLGPGPVTVRRPDADIWLDGGHNLDAANTLANFLSEIGPAHLILGMLANKNAKGFIQRLAPYLHSLTALPVAGHDHHRPADLADLARALRASRPMLASDLKEAISNIPRDGKPVLIAGSLYLAGEVLLANQELPD